MRPIDQISASSCRWCKTLEIEFHHAPGHQASHLHKRIMYVCENENGRHASGTEPCTEIQWRTCPFNHEIENIKHPMRFV